MTTLAKITSLQQQGKLKEALEFCQEALETESKDSELWHVSGLIAAQLGEIKKSIAFLKQAATLETDSPLIQTHFA